MKSQEYKGPEKLTVAQNIKIALKNFVIILAISFIGFLIISRFDIGIL